MSSHVVLSDVSQDCHDSMKDSPTESVEMSEVTEKNEKKAAETVTIDDKTSSEDDNWNDDDKDEDDDNFISRSVELIQRRVKRSYGLMKQLTRGYFWPALLLPAYTAYFIYAMFHRFGDDGSIRLLVCTILGLIIITRHSVARGVKLGYYKLVGEDGMSPKAQSIVNKARIISRWVIYAGLVVFVVWILVEEGQANPQNLIGIPGLLCMILLCLLFSSNPRKIHWHTIIWSIGLQFIFAVCSLRYKFGREAIIWMQDRLEEFFASAQPAFIYLFGSGYRGLGIAFFSLPLGFMVSAFISLLYYLGAMQFVVEALGNFFRFVLDVHHVEAVAVSGGIFLEGALLLVSIRPFLRSVTRSELFTIITSIFSSLGGAFLALIQSFGIPLLHVLPALVISAPATFLVCKLMVPEGRRNKKETMQGTNAEEKKPSSMLDAYQAGAILGLTFVGNVLAAIFAFIAGITWVNITFEWFGDRVGLKAFTLDFVFSYLFYPVALAMGVTPSDCRQVAKFLGIRLFAGNVVAFQRLREVITNRELYEDYMVATNYTGMVEYDGDNVILGSGANGTLLLDGFLSERSEVISIYSMCGFSSVTSVGITMSMLNVFIPERRAWLSKMAILALIAGNTANCMTGAFASIFFQQY